MIQASRDGLTIAVKVIPRAACDEIVGPEGDSLKVRLKAPPMEGRANEALVRLLADRLHIPRANVEIVRGAASRHKLVRVQGVKIEQLQALWQAPA